MTPSLRVSFCPQPEQTPAMTATHSIASTLLVAIDISKHRHEVLIGIPGKKRRRRMTITNTLDDFQRLTTALCSYDLPVQRKDPTEPRPKAGTLPVAQQNLNRANLN